MNLGFSATFLCNGKDRYYYRDNSQVKDKGLKSLFMEKLSNIVKEVPFTRIKSELLRKKERIVPRKANSQLSQTKLQGSQLILVFNY